MIAGENNRLDSPWDYQALSPDKRKDFDDELQQLEKLVKNARNVRNFIVDEEYWTQSEGPMKKLVVSIYEQRLKEGLITPRP